MSVKYGVNNDLPPNQKKVRLLRYLFDQTYRILLELGIYPGLFGHQLIRNLRIPLSILCLATGFNLLDKGIYLPGLLNLIVPDAGPT